MVVGASTFVAYQRSAHSPSCTLPAAGSMKRPACETLAFVGYLADQEDEVQVRRDRGGVVTTAGLNLGPRRGGLLWRLLGRR
jgi:hypothetical protein